MTILISCRLGAFAQVVANAQWHQILVIVVLDYRAKARFQVLIGSITISVATGLGT